jgi:hypothetical protein
LGVARADAADSGFVGGELTLAVSFGTSRAATTAREGDAGSDFDATAGGAVVASSTFDSGFD